MDVDKSSTHHLEPSFDSCFVVSVGYLITVHQGVTAIWRQPCYGRRIELKLRIRNTCEKESAEQSEDPSCDQPAKVRYHVGPRAIPVSPSVPQHAAAPKAGDRKSASRGSRAASMADENHSSSIIRTQTMVPW